MNNEASQQSPIKISAICTKTELFKCCEELMKFILQDRQFPDKFIEGISEKVYNVASILNMEYIKLEYNDAVLTIYEPSTGEYRSHWVLWSWQDY